MDNHKKKNLIKNSTYIEHDKLDNFINLDMYTEQRFDEDNYEEAGFGASEDELNAAENADQFYNASEDMPSFKTSEFYPLPEGFGANEVNQAPTPEPVQQYQATQFNQPHFDIPAQHSPRFDFNSFANQDFQKAPAAPSFDVNYQDQVEMMDYPTFDENLNYSHPIQNTAPIARNLSLTNQYNTQEFLVNAPSLNPAIAYTSEFNFNNFPAYQQAPTTNNVPEIYQTTMFDYNQFNQQVQQLDEYAPYQSFDNSYQQAPQVPALALPSNLNNSQNQNQLAPVPYNYNQQYQAPTGFDVMPMHQNNYANQSVNHFEPFYQQTYNQAPVQVNFNNQAMNNFDPNRSVNVYQQQSHQTGLMNLPTQSNYNQPYQNANYNQNVDHTHAIDITRLNNFNPRTQTFKPSYRQAYTTEFVDTATHDLDLSQLTFKSRERIKNLDYLRDNNLIDLGQYYKARARVVKNDRNEDFSTRELNVNFDSARQAFNKGKK